MRALIFFIVMLSTPAMAFPSEKWGNLSPATREWFESLMQPDNPTVSCCGAADGYQIDHWEFISARNEFDVTLMDGRRFEHVPAAKMQWKYGNPTGYDILFVNGDEPGAYLFCLILGSTG